MSKLRQYISDAENGDANVDFERIFNEWDIPLDENITRHEADVLLRALINQYQRPGWTCVIEGMGSAAWVTAVEFTLDCLRHGVIPYTYVKKLLEHQHPHDNHYWAAGPELDSPRRANSDLRDVPAELISNAGHSQ